MNPKNSVIIGKNVETEEPVAISLDDIIEDRALFQANSRGGKSYIVRKFAEQSFGIIQQIIIDPEGEYATLREKFDYLLVGNKDEGAEIQISVKIAEVLALKLLESGISAIIDLSELLHPDKVKFVKIFADVLANQRDKKLWHPIFIIIDECHLFAPEKGQGEAESLNAVMALASKGGKRGYTLIAATQRPAKLSKNVTNELNTKFIGRAGSYDDIQRSKQELGLPKSTSDSMFRIKHEFFALGPGISPDEVIRIKADPVKTTHKTNYLNQSKIKTSTPAKIKKELAIFENLPEEAEKELKTKESLEKKINELSIDLRKATLEQPKLDPLMLEKERKQYYAMGRADTEKQYKEYLQQLEIKYNVLKSTITVIEDQTSKVLSHNTDLNSLKNTYLKAEPQKVFVTFQNPAIKEPLGKIVGSREEITVTPIDFIPPKGGAIRLLKAAKSFYPKTISKAQACLFAELAPTSGTTGTYLSELRTKGLVIEESSDIFKITELGMKIAGDVDSLPTTNDALQNAWTSKLSGKTKDMLKVLCNIYPNSIEKTELAAKTEMAMSGTFTTYLSILRSNGLMEYVNSTQVKASKELFPEMIA